MRFFTQHERDSCLHRLNPTVKLLAVFIASLGLLIAFDPYTPALFYLVGLAALLALGRIPVKVVAAAHLPFLAFAFSVLWVNLFFRSTGAIVFRLGPLTVTESGIAVGASLALRTLAIGVYSVMFVLTTDPTQLVTSLVQNARLSPRFAYGTLAAYRFLPVLQTEFTLIQRAHAIRGVRDGRGAPRAIRRLARAALPLLVSAIRRAERVAIALESRGLGAFPTRTVWRPTPVRARDYVFLIGAVMLSAGILALTYALGLFRGWTAITVF